MIHYEHCPVCQSANIIKVLAAKDYTVSQDTFNIWQCAHCSLRFTQDVPAADEIGKYYKSEDYISHTESSRGIINALYLQVRKFTLRSKRNFVEEYAGGENRLLLDVGAGTGAFVHYMQKHGWKAEGIEPDDNAISRALSAYGIHLRNSSELFRLPPHSYDAITLWHVLEHVHELHKYMTQLKTLLQKDGSLFIAVPNYTSVDAEIYQGSWAAYEVPRHLYHFSPASMQQLASLHGLTIEKCQPMWFDSFYVSMLSEKYQKKSAGVVRGFLSGLRSNSKALAKPRKASSLIYVMRASHDSA